MISFWLWLRRNRLWQGALVLAVLFTLYWTVFAARRYVSEAHIVVESLQAPSPPLSTDVTTLLSGTAPSRDILLLRDFLQSADMLTRLQARFGLREHYSSSYDVFSRLPWKDVPVEWLLSHYRSRVTVEYDDYAGVLVIQAQAYTPETAHAIGSALVEEGERFMNELAQRLAREQMSFAEREVSTAGKRMAAARQSLIGYQNRHGLVSPAGTVENISAVVARLESELATLQTRRRAMQAYLSPGAPDLVQLNEQVRALEAQVRAERGRLASSNGGTLNRLAEEYDRLVFEAAFQQDMYKTALGALERARVDASRMLKKVSVLQQPTLPESSLQPGRLYNSALYLIATLLLAGIAHLLIAIIREHRD